MHTYLHRAEGDIPTPYYWYQRASRKPDSGALADEWDDIAIDLI